MPTSPVNTDLVTFNIKTAQTFTANNQYTNLTLENIVTYGAGTAISVSSSSGATKGYITLNTPGNYLISLHATVQSGCSAYFFILYSLTENFEFAFDEVNMHIASFSSATIRIMKTVTTNYTFVVYGKSADACSLSVQTYDMQCHVQKVADLSIRTITFGADQAATTTLSDMPTMSSSETYGTPPTFTGSTFKIINNGIYEFSLMTGYKLTTAGNSCWFVFKKNKGTLNEAIIAESYVTGDSNYVNRYSTVLMNVVDSFVAGDNVTYMWSGTASSVCRSGLYSVEQFGYVRELTETVLSTYQINATTIAPTPAALSLGSQKTFNSNTNVIATSGSITINNPGIYRISLSAVYQLTTTSGTFARISITDSSLNNLSGYLTLRTDLSQYNAELITSAPAGTVYKIAAEQTGSPTGVFLTNSVDKFGMVLKLANLPTQSPTKLPTVSG